MTRTTEHSEHKQQSNNEAKPTAAHAQAINYLMMLLNEAYPFQFKQAYASSEDRTRAQNVWMTALNKFSPKRIKKAAEKAICSGNKFMPSLGEIIQYCQQSYEELGLKQPLQAYYEACNTSSRMINDPWSHKAVYLAAKATGWFFLKSEPQRVAFPVFERNYHILCQRLQDGEDLRQEIQQGLEDFSKRNIIQQIELQARQQMQDVMNQQGIDPVSGRRAFQEVMKELK